eukprot:CAMPEP_0182526464 /NCGR_PEP_ID=MMETSP1323-20130603/3206_1 /TAXON_ID=236787 /ORGANISM="Florenciella parvula, Strain RCC1693" /LENGTH=95 /DNA_ID=CAMNT_0024735321 /DNA_START=76 /DNA_END=359 /DNA_ORIENTATION=-
MQAVTSFSRAVIGSKRALLSSFEEVVAEKMARDKAWTTMCPDTGASIGQHFRHSIEHFRILVEATDTAAATGSLGPALYDQRMRGNTVETSVVAA